jgi:nuclease-like protein
MAQVLRDSGRYVSRAAIEKRRKLLATILACTAVVFGGAGYLIGMWLRKQPLWMDLAAFVGLAATWLALFVYTRQKIEELEKERAEQPDQTQPETAIGSELEELPEQFRVIHHLTSAAGNADHVVVGPTGVFVLDVKAWKGVVSSDGNGELLWNQYTLDEPIVRQLTDKVLRIEEKVGRAGNGFCPRFQALLVFTAAHLEMDRCNSVYCLRPDQLRGHILAGEGGPKLTPRQIDELANGLIKILE